MNRDATRLPDSRKATVPRLGRNRGAEHRFEVTTGDYPARSIAVGCDRYRPRRCPRLIVCMNGAGLRRLLATTAMRRVSRSERSPGGWDGRRPPSRRTCTTRLRLTKDLGVVHALIARSLRRRLGVSQPRDAAARDRRHRCRQVRWGSTAPDSRVVRQQPPVGRSAQLGDRDRSAPRGRRCYRNRGN